MPAPIAIIGAPTNIGIKPYDDGRARRLDMAPGVLRDQGLAARLGAEDLGDVVPPPYRDFLNPRDVPAVDSPTPGGLRVGELAELLAPLARHPKALGLELTIYDPELDPDLTSAAKLAYLLEHAVIARQPVA